MEGVQIGARQADCAQHLPWAAAPEELLIKILGKLGGDLFFHVELHGDHSRDARLQQMGTDRSQPLVERTGGSRCTGVEHHQFDALCAFQRRAQSGGRRQHRLFLLPEQHPLGRAMCHQMHDIGLQGGNLLAQVDNTELPFQGLHHRLPRRSQHCLQAVQLGGPVDLLAGVCGQGSQQPQRQGGCQRSRQPDLPLQPFGTHQRGAQAARKDDPPVRVVQRLPRQRRHRRRLGHQTDADPGAAALQIAARLDPELTHIGVKKLVVEQRTDRLQLLLAGLPACCSQSGQPSCPRRVGGIFGQHAAGGLLAVGCVHQIGGLLAMDGDFKVDEAAMGHGRCTNALCNTGMDGKKGAAFDRGACAPYNGSVIVVHYSTQKRVCKPTC